MSVEIYRGLFHFIGSRVGIESTLNQHKDGEKKSLLLSSFWYSTFLTSRLPG